MCNKLTLKEQIIINSFEECFFLNLAIRIRLPYNSTKIQIKKIHESILNGNSDFGDYSPMLQKSYTYYLEHLEIIQNTISQLKQTS